MSSEHEAYIRKIRFDKMKVTFFRVFILISIITLWEISANLKWVDPFLTSSPSRMIRSFIGLYNDGTIFRHIYVTCYETILGFSLGTILGTIIAIILWWCPLTAKVLDPYLVVLNALPKVALAPIIIFWVGTGTSAIIIIALLISIVTTIIAVFTGFKEIDKEKLLLMKTFQASKLKTLRYLIIPYSIPILISALKINVGLSWVGVIMGEFLVAREGLGFLIVYGGQISQLNMVMMSIVILSFLAFIMYKLVFMVEKKYLKDS
ncbi:ABC transporter permease [Clostridium vincentii]|uniref:Putative aliphatic sulfonates transport permease protein SsuC n=1 Tax=Clostridium vincentii TaxID=52704 RepID=A0A2T0BHV3_9CLOT|nr:ABC transporter permease [Clostridium vincentii]PRR83441.1 putative aliphatic sulfonates transport permease protein SsuC [Clostridium vincentii]